MKTIQFFLFCWVFLLCAAFGAQAGAKNQLRIVNDTQINFNEVSGPGKAASSLTNGTNYIENLNLYARGNRDRLNYNFNIGGRTTNDRRYDTAEFALTSLKGHFDYLSHQVDAGDIFESYSKFSLDSSLKGTAYKYYNETDNLPNVSVVYGVAYPRWENLWQGYGLTTVQRQVLAGNITHDISPVLTAGLSLVHSDDSEPVTTADPLYDNNVYAVNFNYTPIPGLTLKLESAISDTSENYAGRTHSGNFHGNAQRIEVIGDGAPSRVILEYERISPKFKSLTGSAIADKELFNSSWRYRDNKNISTNLGFLWFRNHINCSPLMSHTWQPKAGINIRKLFGRRYANSSLSYKLERKKDNSLSTLNHYLTLTHSDRYGIVDNSTTLGLNSFDTDKGTRNELDYTASTTFNARFRKNGYVIKPMISGGTFFYENQLIHQTNQVLQYSIGLGLDIPKRRIYSKFTVGQNKLHAFGQDNSDKWFTRFHIYFRPKLLGYLNQSTFSLRGAINDYSFSTGTRDFMEKTISLGINIPFSIK